MNTNPNTPSQNREAAVQGLAIVGFIALVGAGMWLAVFSARFVPGVVSSIGAAAVSLSQVFTPSPSSSLSVIPTASSTIPFGGGTVATSTATTTTPVATTTASKPAIPTRGTETSGTYPIGGTGGTPTTLSGFPDFVTSIEAVGYLTTASPDSFVASGVVPTGARPAVKFNIRNAGTNQTGPWRFSASIPAQTSFVYQSNAQQTLLPGDSIEYTLGFDQANRGTNEAISITADFDNAIADSNMNNNTAAVNITVQ